jgi:hypothetical protein
MSELATFLELVHTSGSRWRTLYANAELNIDPGAAMEGAAKMFGSMGMPMPPMPPGLNAIPIGTQQRRFRIVARGRESVRIEQTGDEETIAILRSDGTASRSSSGEWSFDPIADKTPSFGGRTSLRMGGPVGGSHAFGLISMLDSSPLLGSCRFESAEAVEIEGRPAVRSSGKPHANTFPIGLVSNGLHPGTTRVELSVDVATGIVLRFDEQSDSGLVSSRSVHIVSVDEPVDGTPFDLPVDGGSTKVSRGLDRFDDSSTLAGSVNFAVYVLDPAPSNTRPLCMRESADQTRITYLPMMQGSSSGRFFQPSAVTSTRPNQAARDFHGEGWQRGEVQGNPAWIWNASKDEHVRSHVHIAFRDADVELSGEFSAADAQQLAGTLRKVEA